ncbi:Phosphoglycerate dehydrogenase [Propionibacterium cyclohexanicum]|uniref:Phosphoglycerate dehydrogenase n=1 Tax=Propionibacterium cyclohexanicum TaxID=64702 RepID=A0A1H9TKD3_9ACTN|nr:2-hydroxyacid dehydrogenase [Propionibacterium cyclohexanicum]SER97562.1 Phosphoglycerate dehydrogenase [Propionibacterium cyclohexanicum]
MLTVTVPDPDLFHRLADMRDRVNLIQWDLLNPLPDELAHQVNAVQIGHYWTTPDRWQALKQLPGLKYVLLPSAGFEHALPLTPPGVTICNGRGVHSGETAELAMALILVAQRELADAFDAQRKENWLFTQTRSLADQRVLVIGAGSVARALVERLRPFEVEITEVARTARPGVHAIGELPELLPDADIVVLTVPYSPSTHHLLDAVALAALPDNALVVNVARGRVVDTEALLTELTNGRLRAALDVTDPEPLPAGHQLWHAPNTIITAHQGGNTPATFPRVAALLRRQIDHLLAGEEPENVVAHT